MVRKAMFGVVMVMAMMSGVVFGTVYDYTTAGMDGTDWGVISSGSAGWAAFTQGADWRRIAYGWGADGGGRGSQVASAWIAPVGESITRIDFKYTYNANPVFFTPVVYRMGAFETLSSSTAVAWQASASGWVEGRDSITFSQTDNVQKVAMGLNVPQWGYVGYFSQFSDVVITTVPEPATIGLLSLGGLLLRRRK